MKFKKSLASVLSTATFLSLVCGLPVSANSDKTDNLTRSCKSTSNNCSASRLVDLGFTFGDEKIKDDTDISRLKLDLFEGDNLNTALMHGLDFIINDNSSPYVDTKESVVGKINENTLINEGLKSTINYIKTKKENDSDKNLEIFKRLHTLEAMIKSDKSINEDNTALKFISAMKSAYQMVISRSVAQKILEDNREAIESMMGSETYSASSELSASIPFDGFSTGISVGIGTNQQATETSFYKIDNSGTIGLSIGTGLKDYLSANASSAFTITNSLVFYSLEEFLDAGVDKGNISFLKLKDEDLKKVISSRKQMQSDEDKILIKIKTSVEPFLKSSGIVPQNLKFKMPVPTYSGNTEKNLGINIGSKLAAEASCLARAGMNVSSEASLNKIKSYHPYLDLIDENFLVNDYCSDVDDLVSYLKTSKTHKYEEIIDNISAKPEDEHKAQKLSIMVSNLKGDLNRYNASLAVIADEDASQEFKSNARKVKKEIEKNWIGAKFLDSSKHNRENMLKIAISVGAYLRSLATSEEEQKLFAPLYHEVQNLSLLQKFTNKVFFKSQPGFDTSRKSNTISVRGETFVDIPFVGKTDLAMAYSDTESPLYSENSQDITITTQLPIINGKLYGSETLKNKLKSLITKISQANDNASLALRDAVEMVDKSFDNITSSYGMENILSTPTSFSLTSYMNLNFYLTTVPKTEASNDLIPLPDSDLIEKNRDTIILKLTKRIDSLSSDITLKPQVVSVHASQKFGKASSKIGEDSLIFTVNKFNTCELGKNSSSISGLWERFKQGQKNSLKGLFINLNDKNSNVRYELQSIYSMIINNIKNKSNMDHSEQLTMTQATENIFRSFLTACKELQDSQNDNATHDKAYEKAVALLDSVLKLNYNLVWHPALLNANSK